MSFSLTRLINAIFNGTPANENVASYTAQVTYLISLYVCFVALFLLTLFIQRLKKRLDINESSRSLWIWMAGAMAFSIFWIAGYIVYSLAAGDW